MSTALFGVLNRIENAPEAEVLGAEVDLQWQLSEHWYLGLSGAYIETELKDFTTFDAETALPKDFSGAKFPNTPELTYSTTLKYSTDLSQDLVGDFALVGSYQDETVSTFSDSDLFDMSDYYLLHASATVATVDKHWALTFWGRNLTNEYYLTSVVNSLDTAVRFTGAPRTFGVRLTYNW